MEKKEQADIIWFSDIHWHSYVDLSSTVSELSLWQSVIYVMKKNKISKTETEKLERRLIDIEDTLQAEYIEEAIKTNKKLYYATPKKRSGDDIKPKSNRIIPPSERVTGIISINDIKQLDVLEDDDYQYLKHMLINQCDVKYWLPILEEHRQQALLGLPIAGTIYSYLSSEAQKSKFKHNKKKNKSIPPTKAFKYKVPNSQNVSGVEPTLIINWNDSLSWIKDNPPHIKKNSLNEWPMLRAFKFLDDPVNFEKEFEQKLTKSIKGTIRSMLLYIKEAEPKHKKDEKIDIYQISKSLSNIANKLNLWAPEASTIKNHLKKYSDGL
jgi:hypothetical protein